MSEIRTPLEIAVQADDIAAVKRRFQMGDTPNDLNHLRIPALYDALQNNSLDMLQLFLASDADFKVPYNKDGYSPFIYACLYCELETIQWLFSNTGVVLSDDVTSYGVSAMHVAAQRGRLDIVEYLVARGADIFAETNNGETPLIISLKSKTGLAVFNWLLGRYTEHQCALDALVMDCFAHVFDKQRPNARDALEMLLPYVSHLPDESSVRAFLMRPGKYSSAPLRSLDMTLSSRLSCALFARIEAERLSRAHGSDEKDCGVPASRWSGLRDL